MQAQFAFIAKLDETECCKPWLTIRPCVGIIEQGTVNDLLLIWLFSSGVYHLLIYKLANGG